VPGFDYEQRNSFQIAYGYWDQLAGNWDIIRANALRDQERVKQDFLSKYDVNSRSRAGQHEQERYFIGSFTQYGVVLGKSSAALDACRVQAAAFARDLTFAVQTGTFAALTKYYGHEQNDPTKTSDVAKEKNKDQVKNREAANESVCVPRALDGVDVPRPKLGSEIPLLHDFVGWLIESESQAFALLVGLVGFGLFGTLVSSFVRPGASTDLMGAVCRGTSAAIVVFLAAYGGIAIVAQSQSDPNPYLVFVTCLVGAVFSEEVWKWAGVRLVPGSKLDESNGSVPQPK
jgi:hypothetical protein